MKPKRITVALAGNPNSGKTTIFNNLTGAKQHVGNYPGVTVEKKEGFRRVGDVEIRFVDLPGTYSLTAYSVEEVVTRNFLIEEKPDIVVDIVDASNLERNLYLGVQLIELQVPLILAFNMSDVALRRGYVCDRGALSQLLGAPIVETVGNKAEGMGDLLDTILAMASGELAVERRCVNFGREIEDEITKLEALLTCQPPLAERYRCRWVALKLLEADAEVQKSVEDMAEDPAALFRAAERSRSHLTAVFGEDPEIVVSDRRYGFISGACTETVKSTVEARHDMSDRIDAVLANRALGLPIFAVLMFGLFQLTFFLGEPPTQWIEALFGWLGGAVSSLWPAGSDSLLKSLLVDGILGGVGGVVIFLPNIMLLFLAIAFLEDTGYMARAAFLVDKFMHRIGLHGKSFIPMLIGFGCSVPGIMATRTLENRRDRMTTMLVLPLMSCGARLPIYALIIPAFFPASMRGTMLFAIYVIGIVAALVLALVLRKTLFKGESSPFVMELPPYRMPTVRSLLIHMWERSWLYLKKAGTVILFFSVLFWALLTFPRKETFDRDYGAEEAGAEALFQERVRSLHPVLGRDGARRLAEGEHPTLATGRLAAFHALRADVAEERSSRLEAVARTEACSAERRALMREHHRLAHDLRVRDPGLFDAAVAYMDDMEEPYREEVARIRAARGAEALGHTAAGRLGRFLAPVMRPLGFDWRLTTAIVGAFPAKELFVAQLGVVSAVGRGGTEPDALRSFLKDNYSPLTAFCIMLFMLLAMPCMATVAVVRREANSWKWALFQLAGLTALAWVVTLAVYQAGSLLGVGA